MIEKNIRKATWESKILNSMYKDMDSNFLVMFFLWQGLKILKEEKDDSLMLATICDDKWNVSNIQQVTLNSRRWD